MRHKVIKLMHLLSITKSEKLKSLMKELEMNELLEDLILEIAKLVRRLHQNMGPENSKG